MVIGAILKAIFFYFIFRTIRGMLRTYSNYSQIKANMRSSMNDHMNSAYSQSAPPKEADFSNKSNGRSEDVIEADFKVLD